jgi:hypothetical protein
MVIITKDNLTDILLETALVTSDHNNNTLLILHDGSFWVIQPDEDGYFFIEPLEFHPC